MQFEIHAKISRRAKKKELAWYCHLPFDSPTNWINIQNLKCIGDADLLKGSSELELTEINSNIGSAEAEKKLNLK